jgi:hypothetical protein
MLQCFFVQELTLDHTLSEEDDYLVIQFDNKTWLVVQTSMQPTILMECPSTIMGPPRFRSVHNMKLIAGVLICGCGYKYHCGILCWHLLAIEPEYDLSDIDPWWQNKYSY